MKRIMVLDCTLRDGGYCNNWEFGEKNIITILHGLNVAGVELIECGFLSNSFEYNPNQTIYRSVDELSEVIPISSKNQKYIAMINYGEYDANLLPPQKKVRLDGIRVAFHKKNWHEAIEFCSQIKEKGYIVFVQPMVCMNYNDDDFKQLIDLVNHIHLDALYIVDSFGMMKRNDLLRYVQIANNRLLPSVVLGFHAHNNLQLAFSNAQVFVETVTERCIIIDVTIYGMGRGAGNLNSELFLDYLNENKQSVYSVKPILALMDEVIRYFYDRKAWGYNLPNYLAASHGVHPNYAEYLYKKGTLTIDAIDDILGVVSQNKNFEYDAEYIKGLYTEYNRQHHT